MEKIEFFALEETRLEAGFFVRVVCEKLGISERTWYRWKRAGTAPKWAQVALSLLAGDLGELGWNGWFIERGVLYKRELSRKYYNWTPGQLSAEAFLKANGYGPQVRSVVNQGAIRQRAG